MRPATWTPLTWARVRTWVVWLGLFLLALALYQHSNGAADAPAVVQAREHKLSTSEVGRLAGMDVHEGERVQRGQRLARLDTREIDAQIALARAELERTTAVVPATAMSLSTDTFDMRRTLAGEAERAEADLATLRAGALRERAELEALRVSLAQEQDLVHRGLVRAERAGDLLSRQGALEQAVAEAPSRLSGAARRLDAARARLGEWERRFAASATGAASGSAMAARLQPLQAEAEARRIALVQLEAKRSQAELRAPADGIVQSILARSGDIVRPGEPVLTLIERETTQLIAYVPERSGVRLTPGAVAEVRRRVALSTAPRGDLVEGVVSGLSGAVALLPQRFWPNPQLATYGREVYIRVPASAGFAPGEAVDVRFGGAATPEAVAALSVVLPERGE